MSAVVETPLGKRIYKSLKEEKKTYRHMLSVRFTSQDPRLIEVGVEAYLKELQNALEECFTTMLEFVKGKTTQFYDRHVQEAIIRIMGFITEVYADKVREYADFPVTAGNRSDRRIGFTLAVGVERMGPKLTGQNTVYYELLATPQHRRIVGEKEAWVRDRNIADIPHGGTCQGIWGRDAPESKPQRTLGAGFP